MDKEELRARLSRVDDFEYHGSEVRLAVGPYNFEADDLHGKLATESCSLGTNT
jgi:hypothetical protein